MSANNANSFGEVKKEDKSANKKIVFDSKDIDKKEKTDFFVRVEGAEERKKAVIRRMHLRDGQSGGRAGTLRR